MVLAGYPPYEKIFGLFNIRPKEQKEWRLGQWFYNTFDKTHNPQPRLFYEKDNAKAYELIYTIYYIDDWGREYKARM